MKRKDFLQGLALTVGAAGLWGPGRGQSPVGFDAVAAQPVAVSAEDTLRLTWLHHSCVLFEAANRRILVNPFRPLGCTAGYPSPASVSADLVLISSRLFDEGAIEGLPGSPQILFQPGDYQIDGLRVQGIRMAHDNTTPRGERFGINVGWRWALAGMTIVHLGGAAAPITREQEILLAKPDILFIPVGGGVKNYDAAGAKAAIDVLQPKLIVPTMYRTAAAAECDLQGLEAFLALYGDSQTQRMASMTVDLSSASLPPTGFQILTFPES
ncbi:MAG: MBL fold metallo-hydrolase [Synechococcales cyanobacterium]